MNELSAFHQRMGALLAADGIPLHYGDLRSEYHAALDGAILLDRSHEGRILLEGESRFDLINRMSTNELVGMSLFEGRPTVFTNANARILFRAMCYNLPGGLLMISEPGQGRALSELLRRNIFYSDKVAVRDQSRSTAQFAIHGPNADRILARVGLELPPPTDCFAYEIALDRTAATAARRRSIVGGHWVIICPAASAVAIYRQILDLGQSFALQPAGSLTYNVLRIRGGRPAGPELSSEYIPLELGLWDEVNFEKGCYTGQEIIARMESRQRLAKVMVSLELTHLVKAPAIVYSDGKECGKLTSSAASPDGEIFALALIKTASARPGTVLEVGDARRPATVSDYAGLQPAFITD
ncbi:MAG: glycine cleavage system protein T [Chloroflexi bacterium]|nr:glycine cleavage system protein T [Chloroflexota bacterium]